MFLLPMLQEYSGPSNAKPVETRVKTVRTFEVFDYIYLKKGKELLKFKAEFEHMSVTNAIEQYINTYSIHNYDIISEKKANSLNIPLVFLAYHGKFRLEDNLVKTKNYLAPLPTNLLDLLCKKYKDTGVTSEVLGKLFNIAKEYYEEEDTQKLKIIKDLFDSINIELVSSYSIDEKEVEKVKDLIGKKGNEEALYQLKWILSTSKENKNYLKSFGLYDKFMEAAKLNKQNQKVK